MARKLKLSIELPSFISTSIRWLQYALILPQSLRSILGIAKGERCSQT
jgi:hypothetical protein